MSKITEAVKEAITAEAKNFKQTTVTNCSITIDLGETLPELIAAMQTQAVANLELCKGFTELAKGVKDINIIGMNFE